jgi:hypothetical protein
LQLVGDALPPALLLPDSEFLTAIAQDGIYLRVTLKALGHAVHLAFDLGAGIVVLPAAKLPALAL